MTDLDLHSPTPAFRHRLETAVADEYRRARLFRADRRAALRSRLRIAAGIVAAAFIGLTAGLASAQIADAGRRDSLLEAAQAQLHILAMRLDLARAQFTEVRKQADLGLAGAESVAAAVAEQRAAETEVARGQLNVEEIRATSQPPRDDLNAPRAGGRDFVTERFRLDLAAAQFRLNAAEAARDEASRRERLGIVGPLVPLEAELAVTQARAHLASLAERGKLRREFLEAGTPVEELLRRQEQADLRVEAMVAQQRVTLARERLSTLERGHAVGTVTQLEVLRAMVTLREQELELQVLARRIRAARQ
jgi:hypothetical protein